MVGKERETPLVDATVEFLREFDVAEGKAEVKSKKGKEKEVDKSGSGEEGDDVGVDSFIPTKVYDAMKEKKRFDNMRVSTSFLAVVLNSFYCIGWTSGRCRRVLRVLSGHARRGITICCQFTFAVKSHREEQGGGGEGRGGAA